MKRNVIKNRDQFNLRIDSTLVKETKILAIHQETQLNEIVEEAIRDLLKKYKAKSS
jgi:predicted HicB family RNase H-like nuclease